MVDCGFGRGWEFYLVEFFGMEVFDFFVVIVVVVRKILLLWDNKFCLCVVLIRLGCLCIVFNSVCWWCYFLILVWWLFSSILGICIFLYFFGCV